jgi:membrane associated rhomboid family serine protease
MATMNLSFPPFRGFTRAIIVLCTGIYVLLLVMGWVMPELAHLITNVLWLLPVDVMHGAVWQLATYALLHGSLTHILFNMLSLWFVGAYLEMTIGTRKLAELFWVSTVGAGLCTVAFSYSHILHASPFTPTIGASGGIFGILIAFAMLFGDQEFLLFPLPFRMKAKWLVTIYILIALFSLLEGGGDHIAYMAHLGGALFGWLYMKMAPRRGYAAGGSERYYAARNSYYRWKRKRAQRKFEVYMGKHGGGPAADRPKSDRPN